MIGSHNLQPYYGLASGLDMINAMAMKAEQVLVTYVI